jgi:hypothetical protein
LIRDLDGVVAVTGKYREVFLCGIEGVPSAASYCGVQSRKGDATDVLARRPEG